ncbi:MAG TPA: FkbM family methyltransferase [Coriobacteriia bacterium]|nr:FkbM family methyltransferase [Coriobacteriia bacterium]
MKIDVEGFTLSVLRGSVDTLTTHRPILLVETPKAEDVAQFLTSLGYLPYRYVVTDNSVEAFNGEATTNVFFIPHEMATDPRINTPDKG